MKVRDLNEELLNELSVDHIRDGAGKVYGVVKDKLKQAKTVLTDEYHDNIAAIKILARKFRGKEVEPAEFINALKQLTGDNLKLVAIAGITITPGSAITLPMAFAIADKFGINLIPTKSFSH